MGMQLEGQRALVTGADKGIGREVAARLATCGSMLAKIPLGHFARPADVADAVTCLLSDHAAMIHGVTLPIDGGYLSA